MKRTASDRLKAPAGRSTAPPPPGWIALVDDGDDDGSAIRSALAWHDVGLRLERIGDAPEVARLERMARPPRLLLLSAQLRCASPESVFLRLRHRHPSVPLPLVVLTDATRPVGIDAGYWRLLGAADACPSGDIDAIARAVACLLAAGADRRVT